MPSLNVILLIPNCLMYSYGHLLRCLMGLEFRKTAQSYIISFSFQSCSPGGVFFSSCAFYFAGYH